MLLPLPPQRRHWPLLLVGGVVLLFASLLLWLVKDQHRQLFAEEQGARLQAVLAITSDSLRSWQAKQQRLARMLVSDPLLLAAAAQLSKGAAGQDGPPQQQIREQLGRSLAPLGFEGFQLIDGEGRILASHDPFVQGALSRVALDPGAIGLALGGEVVLTPPLPRPLASTRSGEPSRLGEPVIMVLLVLPELVGQGPLLLALQIDPDGEFAAIFGRARWALSDETYAVDRNGMMLSESRFTERLWTARLLPVGSPSALNLRVAAPRHDHGLQPLSVAEPVAELPLTEGVRQLVLGGRGMDLQGYADYRGSAVIGAWLWDSQLGYGLITEINAAEAYALAARASRFTLLWFAAFAAVLLLLATSWWLASRRREHDNQLLQQLLAAAPIAIAFTDSQGRYQLVHARFASRLGMTPQAIHGGLADALLPLNEVRLLRELARQASSSGQPVTVRQQLNGAAGAQQLLLTLFALPAGAGGDAGYCVLIRDETQVSVEHEPWPQQQQARSLRQQQLWQASSARLLGRLGEILGRAVARLTSLNTIAAGELLPLRALVTDLLELSLAESGQLQLERQPFDWAELVRQASERYGLTLNAPLTLPAQVMGDRLRLNQLLDYLLSALSQLAVDSKPVLRWQAEVLSVGRQRLQLQLLLPPALQPALYQWLGYVPGPQPFDGRLCADLKLRLCAHWLLLMDGELAVLLADEPQTWSGLHLTLFLEPAVA